MERVALTVAEVAARLGITTRRVRQLLAAHPESLKFGSVWMIPESRLADLAARDTKRGRKVSPKPIA